MVSCTGKISDRCVQLTPCRQRRTAKLTRNREEGVGKHHQQGKTASPSLYLAGFPHAVTITPESDSKTQKSLLIREEVTPARRCKGLRSKDEGNLHLHIVWRRGCACLCSSTRLRHPSSPTPSYRAIRLQ